MRRAIPGDDRRRARPVEIDDAADGERPRSGSQSGPGPDPNPFLDELRTTWERRDENQGELRLVAWVPGRSGGQVIEPAVDRHRGFTAVLVHLQQRPAAQPGRPAVQHRLAGRRSRPLEARVQRS